jgi:pyrroloquinoline-quinone synthase
MDVLARIDSLIEERHLLTHPFYTKWVAGTLPLESIRGYATRYYQFESNFPRFLSAIHSRTEDAGVRQMLLDNLWDEEAGEENHAELWLRFAEGLGLDRESVKAAGPTPATRALVETYRKTSEGPSVAAGVAALYAYESQVPAIAEAKIRGLKEHYDTSNGPTLSFWHVHASLDVQHAAGERATLAALAESEPDQAIAATRDALDAWWGLLSESDAAVAA